MANQGAKKRKDENTQHMSKIRLIMIACNILYIIVRFLITHASFTWKHWIGLVITSLGYGVPYISFLFTDYGELIDGGFDMTTAGMCGYLHDVLYITCFVQLGSIISGKFWYANYLVIPAFGTYKASSLIKEFLSHGSEGGVEDEKTLAKRGRRWREKLLEITMNVLNITFSKHSLKNCSSNIQNANQWEDTVNSRKIKTLNSLVLLGAIRPTHDST